MITSIDLVGQKYTIDDTTRKYIMRKIGRLDRYLPSHARKSVSAEVRLRTVNRDHGNKHEAEVILIVPDHNIAAKDCTTNMMAAIDIVEAKLLVQLRRYKQEHVAHIGNRRLLARFKRSYAREL